MHEKNPGPFRTFVFGLVLAGLGLALTYYKSWPDYQLAKSSLEWPRTTGLVEFSDVSVRTDSENKLMFMPVIKYTYTVGKKKFVSSQIYFGSSGVSTSSSADAYQYTTKFPVGKNVAVFYRSSSPEEALLEPGLNMFHYLFLGGTSLFFIIGLILLVSSLFTKAKTNFPGQSRKHDDNKRYGSDRGLDEELQSLKRSSTVSEIQSPESYRWIVRTSKKEYGPYTYQEIVELYEKGKLKDDDACYAQGLNRVVSISAIIQRKAS